MTVDLGAPARPARAAPRALWRVTLLGLATAVILGILAMHGFSVGHHGGLDNSAAHAATGAHATAAHDTGEHSTLELAPLATPMDLPHVQCPAGGCDDSSAMAMMCVFVLLTLGFLLTGRLGRSWRWQPPWLATAPHSPPTASTTTPGVSLVRLCISRT